MGLEGSQSYFLGEKKTIELMAAAGFRAFPLMDYPLIVTDLAVFRDFIRP